MCSNKTLKQLRIKTEELNHLEKESAIKQEMQIVSIVQALTDMVLLLDEDGVIKYANPSSERVLGYTPSDLVGFRFNDLICGDVEIAEHVDNAIELRVKSKSGELGDVHMYVGELIDLTLHLYILVIKGKNITDDSTREQ